MAKVFATIPTLTYSTILSLLISVFFSIACSTPGASVVEAVDTKDCYPERETTREWKPSMGTIQKIGTIYAVVSEQEGRRFNPCNLEEKWHREGQKVEFSGLEKQIMPYERLSAIPFVLHTITAVDE